MLKLIALALLASGCLSIEADIDQTCVSRTGIAIEGVAMNEVTASFVVDDMSDVHELLEYNAELEFVRAEIRPTSGITSLDFVDAASVAIEGTPVYTCDGNCPMTDGLEMLATARQSATPYLSADTLAIDLSVRGQLPAHAWTVDVDVCVKGTASYELAP